MRLNVLMNETGRKNEYEDVEIKGITNDSRKVKKDWIFVAIAGEKFDGHNAVNQAVLQGAYLVVTERSLGVHREITVADTRETYALLCAAFYGYPAERLKIIAVTGTNGKTSTATLIRNILTQSGYKTALIGTINNDIDGKVYPSLHTTPDACELHRLLKVACDSGCEYVVMETSSHALCQKRLHGIRFKAAVFTNLSQDHLDYHRTMDDYYEAKISLFYNTELAIISADDHYGRRMIGEIGVKTVTYSAHDLKADYTACDIVHRENCTTFAMVGKGFIKRINTTLPGDFSVKNIMAAVTTCVVIGIDADIAAKSVETSSTAQGRAERVPNSLGINVIIDYAHTPDGIENILKAVKATTKRRVSILFGCGGDRDRSKRPKMAEAAARNADFIILTSDNPRSERPCDIIKETEKGLLGYKTPYVIIEDRRDAIFYALDNSQKGDVVILAGKGHEKTQILKNSVVPFDEREIVKEYELMRGGITVGEDKHT